MVFNITLHGIGASKRPVDPDEDQYWLPQTQLEALLDSVVASELTLTVDDGNESDVDVVLPALIRRGVRATFFIVAGRVGEMGFVGDEDLRRLAEAGMTVGSHGMDHRPWTRLTSKELERELLESKRILEEIVARPVTQAACPYGAYNRIVLDRLRQVGYERVYTSDGGPAHPDTWLQPRTTLSRRDDFGRLDRVLVREASTTKAAVQRLKLAVKRWR